MTVIKMNIRYFKLPILSIVLVLFFLSGCTCETKRIMEPISIKNNTNTLFPGDNAAISADGTVVAFESKKLLFGFQDLSDEIRWKFSRGQIYVRDLKTKKTELISRTNGGIATDGKSFNPSISHDGRFVAFQSKAENLQQEFAAQGWGGAANDGVSQQTYVRDRVAGVTHLVSARPNYGDQVLYKTHNANMVPETGKVIHYTPQPTYSPTAGGKYIAAQQPGSEVASRYSYITQIPTTSTPVEKLGLVISNLNTIVYTSRGDNETQEKPLLFLSSLNQDNVTQISHTRTVNAGRAFKIVGYHNPDISPDGKHIVFEGELNDKLTPRLSSLIFKREDDGKIGVAGGGNNWVFPNGINPTVSSNGAIAFESFGGFGQILSNHPPHQIFLIPGNFTGGSFTKISAIKNGSAYVIGDGESSNPDISDDGKRVVFTSNATNLLPSRYIRQSGGKYIHISLEKKFCKWWFE